MTSNVVQIKITRLFPDAKLPRTATPYSIGADLYAYIKSESGKELKAMIPPGSTRPIRTGIIAVAEPPFSMLVCSRSGMAKERMIFVTNSPGVIDPDYRGEILVLLHNAGVQTQWIAHGDRIAQIILVPAPFPAVSDSDLDLRSLTSLRGEAGFGSTGR